jgi:ABC-type transport system involved in cytochrome bd biosynthesis fused ATPase/permease subunit
MSADLARLVRWLRRARPARADLVRAIGAGLIASTTNVALLVGAVALLVASAGRPGLSAVLGALILIELFAFLRSPLRFAERMSAHRLGYEAVTRWRRWLVVVIGQLSFSQWRRYAAGDLLERALRDTDELQDLWLRCVIPLVTTASVMVLEDIVVGLLAPHGGWWPVAGMLLAAQVLGVAALAANFGPLLRADRALRRARGGYRAELVELSTVTPDLARLGRLDYAQERSASSSAALSSAERRVLRRHRLANVIGLPATAVAVAGLALRPQSSNVWLVVAAMLALATFESLGTVRTALDTAVAVSAGAERLEELGGVEPDGTLDWPNGTVVRLERVTIEEDGQVLVSDASMTVGEGRRLAITGVSGSGKSTLLRTLAALDAPRSGSVTIGGIPIDAIDDAQLRQHLAYVPSEPGLTRGFATDVINLGRVNTRDSFEDLATMHLRAEAATRWENLSRGEAERVVIARALVTSPQIYVLDEPTSGLGVEETASVLALLAATGATIIVATHDPQVVRWCDEVMVLSDSTLEPVSR